MRLLRTVKFTMGEGILAIPHRRPGGDGIADRVGMLVHFTAARALATSVALTPVTGGIRAHIICQLMQRRSRLETGGAGTSSCRVRQCEAVLAAREKLREAGPLSRTRGEPDQRVRYVAQVVPTRCSRCRWVFFRPTRPQLLLAKGFTCGTSNGATRITMAHAACVQTRAPGRRSGLSSSQTHNNC
jgi:hypothetical protein